MPTVVRQAIVPYHSHKMYNLVNDLKSYPEFLPWCSHCEILDNQDAKMTAKVSIQKGAIRHAFTTENTLSPHQSIEMNLVDGPFKSLSGEWTFTSLGDDGCQVKLHLEFEFASRLLSFSFGPVFNSAASTMLKSFINRARNIYG